MLAAGCSEFECIWCCERQPQCCVVIDCVRNCWTSCCHLPDLAPASIVMSWMVVILPLLAMSGLLAVLDWLAMGWRLLGMGWRLLGMA